MYGVSSMGEFDIPSLLTQNEEHKSRLFAPYNPLTGEGSPIERVRLYFSSESYVLIPTYMAQTPTVAAIIDAGGVEQYAAREGIAAEVMCGVVHRLRAVYDFEFWCISCVKSSTRPRAASSRSNSAGPNSSWRIFSLLIYSRGSLSGSCWLRRDNGEVPPLRRCLWRGCRYSTVRAGIA